VSEGLVLVGCWSAKGGAGTTVVSAALALLSASSTGGALLVDVAGDLPAALGVAVPDTGVADWLAAGPEVPADALARLEVPVGDGLSLVGRGVGPLGPPDRVDVLVTMLAADSRPVVVDCGAVRREEPGAMAEAVASGATRSLLVTRACYLALRRALDLTLRPSGVVLVVEEGRALDASDVELALGVPVLAEVPLEPAVARAVDAGLLATRLPRSLHRALRRAA
jgi:MinD-like ATPase involved in chromosome partitioning or flagellar assembly